jgi:hypothetical protein
LGSGSTGALFPDSPLSHHGRQGVVRYVNRINNLRLPVRVFDSLHPRQSLENIKHILEEAGLGMANIVKTTVFLADMSLFADMNKVYATYFDGAFPARSAVAVKALPKDALVEIECIAVR